MVSLYAVRYAQDIATVNHIHARGADAHAAINKFSVLTPVNRSSRVVVAAQAARACVCARGSAERGSEHARAK